VCGASSVDVVAVIGVFFISVWFCLGFSVVWVVAVLDTVSHLISSVIPGRMHYMPRLF